MAAKNSVGFFAVQVKLETCYDLLIPAESEQEAIDVAFHEELPERRLEDFARNVVRVVQMKERVYIS